MECYCKCCLCGIAEKFWVTYVIILSKTSNFSVCLGVVLRVITPYQSLILSSKVNTSCTYTEPLRIHSSWRGDAIPIIVFLAGGVCSQWGALHHYPDAIQWPSILSHWFLLGMQYTQIMISKKKKWFKKLYFNILWCSLTFKFWTGTEGWISVKTSIYCSGNINTTGCVHTLYHVWGAFSALLLSILIKISYDFMLPCSAWH